MASVTQRSFVLAVIALYALSSWASASNFPLAKLDGKHQSQSVTRGDTSVVLAQFSDFIRSNIESGRYVLTATSAPYGVTVYSLDFMSTDGSGLNIYAMDTANYNLYSAGGTFQYYVAFSHTLVTCFNAASGKTSGNGFVVVVECTNSISNCPIRFTLSTSANSAPAPPPVATPRGSVGSVGCQCECCMGNYCSPTLVGFASSTCGSCNPAACASAFPASCPAGSASGSTVALCKSSAVTHIAFGAAFALSLMIFLFFA